VDGGDFDYLHSLLQLASIEKKPAIFRCGLFLVTALPILQALNEVFSHSSIDESAAGAVLVLAPFVLYCDSWTARKKLNRRTEMATIVIKDLRLDKELDHDVMASVRGGWKFGTSSSDPMTPGQNATPPSNPFGGGPDGIQVNNSPDQNPYSFTDLAKKHSYYF
jgi:hypothetical protein